MSWILPVTLVLLVGVLIAAAHHLFVRWMQRASQSSATDDPESRHPDDLGL